MAVTNNTVRHQDSTMELQLTAVRGFFLNNSRFLWHSTGILKKDHVHAAVSTTMPFCDVAGARLSRQRMGVICSF